MPLSIDPEKIVQHEPNLKIINQNTNQRLQDIAGQSSFQDWIKLKDRNAIPNNAPSLLWLDVKPGKRIQTGPFMINDEGVKVSYTNSYWNDPKRIARMHEVIDSAPEGWQAPDWLDVEGVENLYRYFEYRNQGASWEDWKELPGDDPGIDLANYLDQPPQDVLHYDDMDPQYRAYRKIQDWYDRQMQAEADYQAALEQNNMIAAQMVEQEYSQDLAARWDDLEPWQQYLMARDSMTPIEGRPDWTRGTAAGWMGFKTALSVMGLSTLVFSGLGAASAGSVSAGTGTAIGAIAGGIAGAYSGYKAYMGEENELAAILNVFNIPAEGAERVISLISMQAELARQGKTFADIGGLLPAWQASKAGYESQILPIGSWEANAVSKIANAINPEWSSGETAERSAGEIWKFEQGYVVPQVVEGGTMAGEALLEATARINNGEDVTLVYEDMVRKFGYSGTRADFLAQNFLDPMQFVPYLINKAGTSYANKVGDQVLRQAWIEGKASSVLIDALPMGWQQLATAIGKDWGWRSTAGIFDVMQNYGRKLRDLTIAPDGSYTLPKDFSKFQIFVGQLALNKDGKLQPRITIPDSELQTPTNRILKALDWAGRNTPETKAIMAQADLVTALEHILQLDPNNPMKMDQMLHAIADADASKFNELAGAYLASPRLESIRGAVREFLNSKEHETSIKIWQATEGKRQMLEELSVAATHDLADPMTAAKVMTMLKNGQTAELIDLIRTNPRTNNQIIATYKYKTDPQTEILDPGSYVDIARIEKRLDTYIQGRTPWHPGEFAAQTLNRFVDTSTKYFVERYGLKADSNVQRISTLLKSAQSLYLLGLSPNFFVNNLIDGIVTTSYYGIFGVKTLPQLDKFWVENELPRPARMDDAYGPGSVTHSIFTQLNPKDILSEAQSVVSKVNESLGVFTRLSNKIERWQGANAITQGAMQYLKTTWNEGVGFGKMPADLEAKVRAAGIDPDTIYALARSSKTPADFDKKFYGEYQPGAIGRALSEGARRPEPPEGPMPTAEETIAKFDNAIKETADEFFELDGQPLTAELMAKTGLEDMIIDNLRNGMSEDSAVRSALTMTEEALERQRWSDRLTRVESDNARITAEGFKAAIEVFGEQTAENWQKSTTIDYRVAQGFAEVHNLHERGLHTQGEAYKVEVVDELLRQKKIQADENRLRIGSLVERLDPDNKLHAQITEGLLTIANSWEEFYDKKIAAVKEFTKTTREMGWDPERYAVMKKKLADKLNTMASDTRAFEAGIQKNLDEHYIQLLGKTDAQRDKVRTWLTGIREIEADLAEMKTNVFDRMAENPGRANQIYNEFMRNEYMPIASKIQDAYAVGAARLADIDRNNAFIDSEIDEMVRASDPNPRPKTKKTKTATPEVEKPKTVLENDFNKRDDVDTQIERTIYIDQAKAIQRDTITTQKIRNLEEAFIEGVKKAYPELARSSKKLNLALTWMRLRAETWAIDTSTADNPVTPLDFWRVYADIDNVKNTDDALSNWIKSINKIPGEKHYDSATLIREVNGFIEATIRGTDASNFESFTHEMIHTMMYMVDDATLDVLAKHGGFKDADEYKRLRALRDAGKLKGEAELSKKFYDGEEKIVTDATRHMADENFGTGLSGLLKKAFGDIRNILVGLWKKLKRENQDLQFSDEVKNALDTLVLGSEDARRRYDTALNNMAIEEANSSAGAPGIFDVVLGDGNRYKTHYAYVDVTTISDPLVSGKLLDDQISLSKRITDIQKEFPDLFKKDLLTDAEHKLLDKFEMLKQQMDYEDNILGEQVKVRDQIRDLETKLQSATAKKRYKGRAEDIRNYEAEIERLKSQLTDLPHTKLQLEEQLKDVVSRLPFEGGRKLYDQLTDDIKQHTPLSPKEYTALNRLKVMQNERIIPKGRTNLAANDRQISQSIARYEERLQRYGSPDAQARYLNLQDKAAKILDDLKIKQEDQQKAISAYGDAMQRLIDTRAAITDAQAGISAAGLENLGRRVPKDILDAKSRIPLITRDNTRLYDGTNLIQQMKKAIVGTLVEAEDINYKLDPERGDFVGEIPSSDSLTPFEDSALRYDFTDQGNRRLVQQPGDLNLVMEYKKWVEDNQAALGLHLTHDEIYNKPGIIVLIPDVDYRKIHDVNDAQKVLGFIETNDRPIVYGKFAGELAKFLKDGYPNDLGKAYIAKITEAMINIEYWDPLYNNMEGGYISIANPRASRAEIEFAIKAERETPLKGIQPGILNVLEYALYLSYDDNRTQTFVFDFLRKPIEEIYKADSASKGKNVNIENAPAYKVSDEALRKLDSKIKKMVSGTEAFNKAEKWPLVNDVVRAPIDNIDPAARYHFDVQLKQFKHNLDGVMSRLETERKSRDPNTPTPATASARVLTKGGFDGKGKGTPTGDGKDIAMREASSYFVGEIFNETKPSSTKTSRDTISAKANKDTNVVMLARNSEFRNKPLSEQTKTEILNYHKANREFVVGDMPGVDSFYVDYLNEIGAKYTIYYAGSTNRLAGITATTTTKATPTFRAKIEDSFIWEDKNLKSLYTYKGVTLEQFSKALSDIIEGKYDPDSGLHQQLLRSAIKRKLHERDVYQYLGVWKYEIHQERIRRLSYNVNKWALRIKNAYAIENNTASVNSRASTDLYNQYRKVADALQRTKDSGLHPLSKAEMNAITAQMKTIKQIINDYAKLRYQYDKNLHKNVLLDSEVDIRKLEDILAEEKRLRDAQRGEVEFSEDLDNPAPEGWDDLEPTVPGSTVTKNELDTARYELNSFKITDEMLDKLTPEETMDLDRILVDIENNLVDDTDIGTADSGRAMRTLILEEYNKILESRQAPAPQAPEVSTPRTFSDEELAQSRAYAKWEFPYFTDEMIARLTPEEIEYLGQKSRGMDSTQLDEDEGQTIGGHNKYGLLKDEEKEALMLEEYNKLIANKQPPLPPTESGYATHMMNNPTGTTPIPMMAGYAGLEVFDMDLYPLLSSIRDKMRNDMRSYKLDGLNNLDADTRQSFQDWLNTTRINLAETRRGAVDWGITQRDNALLNYSNRTNLDPYLEMIFPYQFWFTRSMGNWAKRMISKPAMVAQMVRRQEMMKKNGQFWGNLPKRLQGKMVIPHAFSESWMGNFMYINPWQNLYPPFNLLSSVNSFNMQANNVNPIYTLQDMVNEKEITQEQMDEAIEKQSGMYWDRAYKRAIEENSADLKNPVTLASVMLSPSLWMTEMFGDKPAENWPSTKTGIALRSFSKKVPGILGPVSDWLGEALEKPEKFVRRNNFAYYGKYGDYKINRMIANMVADHTLDYDRGLLAMINKSGPDYELAQQRLENELSMKTAGSALADTIIAQEWTQIPLATLVTLFPGGLYPIGEEEGMQLKAQMTAAWDELGKGNPYPINNFFNEHEGHLVRTGINDGPELQMKKFLAHNIREMYDALDPVNKGLLKVQLGDPFVEALLSGSIDYEKLTKQDLTIWLDALGGNVPETEIIPQTQRIAPNIFTDGEVKEITSYMDMREQLYPNHAWLQQNYGQLANELARKKYLAKFPELKHYWDWNRKYKYDHPIIGEWSSYYGNADVGSTYQDPFFGLDKNVIQGYLDEKRQRFPDLEWQQEVYFSLPTDDERYAFADANPSLIEAWDWDKAVVANNPTVEMYKQLKEAQYNMASNQPGTPKTPAQVSKNLALLDIHPFAIQELVIRHSTGAALSAGTKAELLRLFQSLGSPGDDFEAWIDSLF